MKNFLKNSRCAVFARTAIVAFLLIAVATSTATAAATQIATSATTTTLAIPEKPENYVTDTAQILSGSERELNDRLAAFQQKTGHEFFIVTLASLPSGLSGDVLELNAVANRIFTTWKIGSKENDDGLLLLIVKKPTLARIEVGRGLEDLVPDITAKEILTKNFTAKLDDESYKKAIKEMEKEFGNTEKKDEIEYKNFTAATRATVNALIAATSSRVFVKPAQPPSMWAKILNQLKDFGGSLIAMIIFYGWLWFMYQMFAFIKPTRKFFQYRATRIIAAAAIAYWTFTFKMPMWIWIAITLAMTYLWYQATDEAGDTKGGGKGGIFAEWISRLGSKNSSSSGSSSGGSSGSSSGSSGSSFDRQSGGGTSSGGGAHS